MRKLVVGAALLWAPFVWGAGELDALKLKLQGEDEAQAAEAAAQLGKSSDAKALDVLLDGLAVGSSPRVQAAMLGALAGKPDGRALRVLDHYAHNRNAELRKKALSVLAEQKDAKVVPVLTAALSDKEPDVRAQAAGALAKRKERSAESKLLKLLKHKDPAATGALAAIATPDLAHRLGEMIGEVPDSLICSTLGDILKRPDFGPEPVRVEIVKTLSKVPGVESTSTLIEYIASTEKDKMRPSRVEAQKIVDQRSSQ
jgi:HEAT repeat protein